MAYWAFLGYVDQILVYLSSVASRMPSFAVSRDSPLAHNMIEFLQRMHENGLLNRYQMWAGWFLKDYPKEIADGEPVAVSFFNFWIFFKLYLLCTIIQVVVFMGELLIHRWNRG